MGYLFFHFIASEVFIHTKAHIFNKTFVGVKGDMGFKLRSAAMLTEFSLPLKNTRVSLLI